MSDIVTLARRHKHVAPTHYEGCEVDHIGCLVNRMADEIEGLRAENERLMQAIGLATTTVPHMQVDIENPVGMMQRVVAEVERLTGKLKLVADALNDTISKYHEVGDQVDRLDAEIERLRAVYVLIASRRDSATCWYEDKIIGCFISREAAEETAKLLMADWRINEYALEGKP